MELAKQIKLHRQQAQMSQEELADRVYVSRQTVSNWETGKSCPDVSSLLLLSEVFHVSLDILIKGDMDMMKEAILKEDIDQFNRLSILYTLLLIALVLSMIPLFIWLRLWALIPCGILFAANMVVAFRIEKMKKDNDIQTYKEIVAFCEGRRLDDIHKQREIGKRPYQKALLVFLSAAVGLVIGMLYSLIF